MWAIHGDAAECRRYLETVVISEPPLAERILRQNFVKRSGAEENFGESHYDDLSRIIEPKLLYDALIRTHPALATSTYEAQFMNFDERKLFRQFATIHRARVERLSADR